MKRSKNFFYRINPNEVLGEAIFQEDKEQWFMQFFHDLRNDDPLSAKTDLAKEIIEEAHSFRAKRSRAGKASAEQRLTKDEQKGTYVQHMLNDVEQKETYVQHMLEDVGMCCNTSQPVAVAVAVAETKELKEGDKSPPLSPEKMMWDMGVKILTESGTPEKEARTFLGKHFRDNKIKLAEVISYIAVARPIDPKAYITKALQPEKPRLVM